MANKKGPLSKVEVFYIQEHVKLGKDIHGIAADLDRGIKSIERCVTKAQKEFSSKPLTASDQFARTKGSVVMTENASTMGDVVRKRKLPPKTEACVTVVKNV
jgi:hypothetical protein